MNELALTGFAPLPAEQIQIIDQHYEETKSLALSTRVMKDDEVIDAVFEEIKDKPVYLENASASIDMATLSRFFSKIYRPEKHKENKDLYKSSMKDLKYNSEKGLFFQNVLSRNSRNPIKALFIGFMRGCRYSFKTRKGRIAKKELKRTIVREYREREKQLKKEKTQIRYEKWKDAIKHSDKPYSSQAMLPPFSPDYERQSRLERISLWAARKDMSAWIREYHQGKRADYPKMSDFLEVRDLKMQAMLKEQKEKRILWGIDLEKDAKQAHEKKSKLNEELEKILHPSFADKQESFVPKTPSRKPRI